MILTASAIKRVQINLQRRGIRITSRQIRDNWNSSLSEKENQKRLENLFQSELVPVPIPPLGDHVITLDEPPELPQNKEITLAEKQTISTVAKDLGFILPQDELKAIAQHSLREIASSLREDSEITSITEIKEAILRNQRKELHTDNKIALAAEKARHSFAISLSQTRGYVDAQIAQVDRQAQIAEVQSRPQIKQVQADQDLQRKLVSNYLEKGEGGSGRSQKGDNTQL